MDKLRFGTAGIPISTPEHNTENGIMHVRKLGLDAMELEFVRSINITAQRAPDVSTAARASDVALTCHAPYFINLNSEDKAKLDASIKRILDSARIAWLCGGWSLTFHAAFYLKMDATPVYNNVKERIRSIARALKDEGNPIWIRPETTGKKSQFGTLDELLRISQEVEQVMPCIDFSHLHARSGKMNSYEEFSAILQDVEKALGRTGLENMHIHTSGIEYTDAGERSHLNLQSSDMNYKELMHALREFKVKGALICESPSIEADALLMQREFRKS